MIANGSVTGSIPATVLLLVTTRSELTFFSVCLCILSTSLTSSKVSYELDTNKIIRTLNPDFYGYIADSSSVFCLYDRLLRNYFL